MVTNKKSQLLASFVVVLATATFLGCHTTSATPDPSATQPQVQVPAPPATPQPQAQVPAPPATPETKTVSASEPKNSEEPSTNGKTDKKKGRVTGMMLALFAIITGHQGAFR